MAGWNEPLPLMDESMINRIIETSNNYLVHVNWRNNGSPKTLKEAVADAKKGIDGGLEQTMMLRPTTKFFEDWMDWNNLVTYLVNRDTGVRTLLSALRKLYTRQISVRFVVKHSPNTCTFLYLL